MQIFQPRTYKAWGHLAFICFVALVTGIYVADVLSVSTSTNNIILVVPLGILLLGLAAALVIGTARGILAAAAPDAPPEPPRQPEPGETIQTGRDLVRALILLAGLGVYVLIYGLIGLDVATFLFVLGALLLLEVRGWFFVPAFAAIFTVIVVGGADLLLHYPMFTLVLP